MLLKQHGHAQNIICGGSADIHKTVLHVQGRMNGTGYHAHVCLCSMPFSTFLVLDYKVALSTYSNVPLFINNHKKPHNILHWTEEVAPADVSVNSFPAIGFSVGFEQWKLYTFRENNMKIQKLQTILLHWEDFLSQPHISLCSLPIGSSCHDESVWYWGKTEDVAVLQKKLAFIFINALKLFGLWRWYLMRHFCMPTPSSPLLPYQWISARSPLFPCFSSDRYTWQNKCPNYSKCSQLCHRDNYCNEGSISAGDSKVLLQLGLIALNRPQENSPTAFYLFIWWECC